MQTPLNTQSETPRNTQLKARRDQRPVAHARPDSAQRFRGLTLVETALTLAILAVVGAVLTPTLNRQRLTAQSIGSLANLSQVGQISALYGNANNDQFATYSWFQTGSRANRYDVAGEGTVRPSTTNQARLYQMTDIIRLGSGRIEGADRFTNMANVNLFPFRRFNHLALQDFAGSMLPDPIFRAPADGVFGRFAADPVGASNIPIGVAEDFRFRNPRFVGALPYASTYLPTTFLFQTGAGELGGSFQPLLPSPSTVNLWSTGGNSGDTAELLRGRDRTDTVFPSLKVQYFEEFDWLAPGGGRFYAFDDARPHVLMVDGSAARRRSSNGVDGFDPRNPQARQLSLFNPIFFGWPDSGQGEFVNQKFRFTKDGLAGIDFTTNADAPDTRRSTRRLRSE